MVYAVGDAVLALASLVVADAIRFSVLFHEPMCWDCSIQTGATTFFVTTQLGLLYIAEAYDPGSFAGRPRSLESGVPSRLVPCA